MAAMCLFGREHDDPKRFEVLESPAGFTALAIASVVVKEQKSHNRVNNEDAAGYYFDDQLQIWMVADAHDGYVASEQAVVRFPLAMRTRLAARVDEPFEQLYLEALLALATDMRDVGRCSGVTYGERFGQPVVDTSVTQFTSVIRVSGQYYACSLGDSRLSVLRGTELMPVRVESLGYGALGSGLTPYRYMRVDQNAENIPDGTPVRFDDPLVRKGADIKRLDVSPGDVLLLWTDGLKFDSPTAGTRLQQVFAEGPRAGLESVFSCLVDRATRREWSTFDNAAAVATIV